MYRCRRAGGYEDYLRYGAKVEWSRPTSKGSLSKLQVQADLTGESIESNDWQSSRYPAREVDERCCPIRSVN
jgi:hypothetical protein